MVSLKKKLTLKGQIEYKLASKINALISID